MLRGLIVAVVTVALALTAWLTLRPSDPGLAARAESRAKPDGREAKTASPAPRARRRAHCTTRRSPLLAPMPAGAPASSVNSWK